MKNKEQLYRQLVDDARADYESRPESKNKKGVYLTWHKSCKEINFWTYWQGLGNYDAEIMLVGQDWGHPDNDSEVIKNIDEINSSLRNDYSFEKLSPTDDNLCKLFNNAFGFDINNRYDNLFFTNIVLGYRSEGTSGGLRGSWVTDDAPYFRRLVDIIEPEVIICLGKDTFSGAVYALTGKRPRIGRYNTFIESDRNPVTVTLPSGRQAAVFAEAHCGAIGTMNRNRPGKKDGSWGVGLERQKGDWLRIKEYYDLTRE